MEKLEIGYEQTFHEGRPYLAQPPPTCHLFVTILSNPPSRKRTSFSNDPLLTYRRKKNPLRKKKHHLKTLTWFLIHFKEEKKQILPNAFI